MTNEYWLRNNKKNLHFSPTSYGRQICYSLAQFHFRKLVIFESDFMSGFFHYPPLWPTTFWDPYEKRGTSILSCFSWALTSRVEAQIHLKVSGQDSSLKSECLHHSFVIIDRHKRLQFLREPFYLCFRTIRRLCWVSTASCAFQPQWPSSETQILPLLDAENT